MEQKTCPQCHGIGWLNCINSGERPVPCNACNNENVSRPLIRKIEHPTMPNPFPRQEAKSETRISIEERFGPYRKPNEKTIPKFELIQQKTLELAKLINDLCPHSPEKFTALTQLQIAKMAANAAIAIYSDRE